MKIIKFHTSTILQVKIQYNFSSHYKVPDLITTKTTGSKYKLPHHGVIEG